MGKRDNLYTMKQAFDNMLKSYKLDEKQAEKRLINSWESVMGVMIANHTKDIYIINHKLYVTLDSPALRNELSLAKSKIVKMMNDTVSKKIILDVILK
jgi:predicted nucleic acid-binding Zn ribbon protein